MPEIQKLKTTPHCFDLEKLRNTYRDRKGLVGHWSRTALSTVDVFCWPLFVRVLNRRKDLWLSPQAIPIDFMASVLDSGFPGCLFAFSMSRVWSSRKQRLPQGFSGILTLHGRKDRELPLWPRAVSPPWDAQKPFSLSIKACPGKPMTRLTPKFEDQWVLKNDWWETSISPELKASPE